MDKMLLNGLKRRKQSLVIPEDQNKVTITIMIISLLILLPTCTTQKKKEYKV